MISGPSPDRKQTTQDDFFIKLCVQLESDQHIQLRRLVFYPLNYGRLTIKVEIRLSLLSNIKILPIK